MRQGLITINQTQFEDRVRNKPVLVWIADGGWEVGERESPTNIFVPFNQVFVFGDELFLIQRSFQLETVLDRIDKLP